jgi:hypothetical protein
MLISVAFFELSIALIDKLPLNFPDVSASPRSYKTAASSDLYVKKVMLMQFPTTKNTDRATNILCAVVLTLSKMFLCKLLWEKFHISFPPVLMC